MKKTCMILLLLSLGACTHPQYSYTKPSVSDQQRSIDIYQCEQEAAIYVAALDASGTQIIGPRTRVQRVKACMGLRGYMAVQQ